MNSLIIFLIFVFLAFATSQTDYCSEDLCTSSLKHIACKNTNDFASSCPSDRKILELSKRDIKTILKEHNSLRNKIALGTEPGLPAAARMTQMIWNEELAFLAELNAKSCKFEHDECRNTKQFKYAGQNIALSMTTGDFATVSDLIKKSISDWYSEIKDAKESDINKYGSSNSNIGHFTQMVNDLSNEIGCAAVQFTDDKGWNTSIFVCNYARTNIFNEIIYETGIPASKCKTGSSQKYSSLCSSKEEIDPNSL